MLVANNTDKNTFKVVFVVNGIGLYIFTLMPRQRIVIENIINETMPRYLTMVVFCNRTRIFLDEVERNTYVGLVNVTRPKVSISFEEDTANEFTEPTPRMSRLVKQALREYNSIILKQHLVFENNESNYLFALFVCHSNIDHKYVHTGRMRMPQLKNAYNKLMCEPNIKKQFRTAAAAAKAASNKINKNHF
jgi:hypothetical protein